MKIKYLSKETRDVYINYISGRLTKHRFDHTLGTEKMAIKLASLHGVNVASAQTAALLHDSCKCLSSEDKTSLAEKYGVDLTELSDFESDLYHGALAAEAAKHELGITDEDILNAIRYHTTGRPGMSDLEKVIYDSDVIEETRSYDGVERLRSAVYNELKHGTFIIVREVLLFLLAENKAICDMSIKTYNSLLKELKTEDKI